MDFTCLHCNKEFTRKWKAKFCSQSCAASYNNKGVRRHGNPAGTCKVCGGPKSDASRIYCSTVCFGNDLRKYSPEESKEITRIRRNETSANYRAKVRDQTPPNADRKAIKEFYARCPKGWEVDHIIPISKGGLHALENLQYLPMSENRRKSNKILVGDDRLERTTCGL